VDRVFETREQCGAKVLACGFGDAADLSSGFGEEDFSTVGVSADAAGEVDGYPERVAFCLNNLPVVNPAADLQGDLGWVAVGNLILGGYGVFQGVIYRIERHQESIAERANNATGLGRGKADGFRQVLEDVVGARIAELAGDAEGSRDIYQEEGPGHGFKRVFSREWLGGQKCGSPMVRRIAASSLAARNPMYRSLLPSSVKRFTLRFGTGVFPDSAGNYGE
jgi:hypothetical protein